MWLQQSGRALIGQPLGHSDWITVDQHRVNAFAEATEDRQWIHVDPERAKAGPFGGPIAHGFLTLSLIPYFFETGFAVRETRMVVNYGLNKVRFTAPVPVGSRLRAAFKLLAMDDVAGGAVQLTVEVAVAVLLVVLASVVVVVTLAVLVIVVFPAVPGLTLTTSVNVAEAVAARLGLVTVMVPVPPTLGVVGVQPAGAVNDTNVVFVGIVSCSDTVLAARPLMLLTVMV